MIEDYRGSIEQGVVVARPVLCGLDKGYRADWRCHATTGAPAHTGVDRASCRNWPSACCRCPTASNCTRAWPRSGPSGARWPRATSSPTGALPRTWPMQPWSTPAIRCACPARTPAAAPSSTATPRSTARPPAQTTRRCSTSASIRGRSSPSTPSCRRRRCSASSTASPPPSPTR
jgi:hypothetical protein